MNTKRIPLDIRFWAKVQKTDGCWLWTGARNHLGYGRIQRGGKYGGTVLAHRVSYALLVGPIPEGLTLDHLCRTPACVNPTHLEPVPIGENSRRSPFWIGNRTHCPQGHPYNESNTYWRRSRAGRDCRACARERERRKRAA